MTPYLRGNWNFPNNIPQGSKLKSSYTTSAAIAFVLATSGSVALAGNYAEGDPRPVPSVSTVKRAEVATEARQWLKTAQVPGYPEGNPRPSATDSNNSRAAVKAGTVEWVRSGVSASQFGEANAGLDQDKSTRTGLGSSERKTH